MFQTQIKLILNHLKPYLCNAMCFTVHIIFINFDNHSPDFGRETCLAPEGFKRSFSGPWPKKVVHHWYTSSCWTLMETLSHSFIQAISIAVFRGAPDTAQILCWNFM